MILLDLLAWIIGLPVAAITGVFVTETLAGLPKGAEGKIADVPPSGRTLFLIPAHDEEGGIGAMLDRLLPALQPHMKVLVVADNCSDRTAEIARGKGVDVVERFDRERRGKGYALAFGRDHLRADPPECVIVLDADCEAGAEDYRALDAAARAWRAPVQAIYLLHPDRAAPPMVQVSNFAFAIKNLLRQRGLERIGAPVVLTGTGMAFPWPLFEPLALDVGSLAEDLELGIALARQGHPPRLAASATVWSAAASSSATLVQRSRWEGGFLAMAKRHGLPLLATGLVRGRWPLFWLGLHLLTPPVALLTFLNCFALAATGVLALLGATVWPLALLLLTDAGLAIALVAGWRGIGRDWLSPAAALRLPLYALWKIPIYLKLLRGGEKSWIRTERNP